MAEKPQTQQPDQPQRRGRGQRGTITSRPSRDTILRSYAAQDAERAERTRDHATWAVREYEASASRNAEREAARLALLERQREQDELLERRQQEEVASRQRAARGGPGPRRRPGGEHGAAPWPRHGVHAGH